MSGYEALSLLISFGKLVISFLDFRKKKEPPLSMVSGYLFLNTASFPPLKRLCWGDGAFRRRAVSFPQVYHSAGWGARVKYPTIQLPADTFTEL